MVEFPRHFLTAPIRFSFQTFPGLMPYKRPLDNKGIPMYQPSAAAYQQLMQLQSQQPYVPVSCEYQSQPTHASVDTIYPSTSTATLNANNLHHHLNLYSQNSINNACIINQLSSNNNNNSQKNPSDPLNNNYLNNFEHNSSNNFTTSTFFADADAQINTPTAQQNSINSSPSKVTNPSNNIEHKNAAVTNAVAAAASPDDGDSENALVQNAKIASGGDDATVAPSGDDENQKAIIDATGNDLQTSNHHDDATHNSSLQSSVDENNLNANSFNSASSSPGAAASLSAIYTTSSIANNNNNSILSRKNSFTTPNQHLVSSSKAPTNNTPSSGKVDSVPDYLSASTLNNHPQAALLSAMFYNQPYQQLAMGQSLYSDPAQLAKEMAQKNYANALKFAVAQQSPSVAGKSPLSTLSPYSGVTLSANGMVSQQPGTSATRLQSPLTPQARPYMPQLTRPMQNPFQQFIRPQMPVNLTAAATNPYYAAAAAHQQFLSQQNLLYSGMAGSMAGQQMVATSGASTTPTGYPYALSQAQAQAMNAQGLPASMMQVPQITSQSSQSSTSAVVLNPYKKMKTS